jgi:hypothetical protein
MSPEEAKQQARDRRETWVMSVIFGALLLLPLAAWGAVRAAPAVLDGFFSHRTGGSLETNAVGSCRAYATSQVTYKRNDWDQDGKLTYAAPFTVLATQVDGTGTPIQLIDSAFAQATSPSTPKHGYIYRDMSTIAGQPIDWEKDFALCATPAVYGRTGYRTFIVKTDGTTYGKDLGSAQFVSDFPADPAAAGWIVAE